jgi:hypothetical protein
MTGYTKLFGSIIASTIWRESKETKIVWITMLAMAKKDGIVEASIPGLAVLAGVTTQECERAINTLLSPDPYSRSKEHEGRRIATVEGGWHILNHAKYRAKMGADQRREYLRLKKAESRARLKGVSQQVGQHLSTMSTHAYTEADPDQYPPTPPPGGNEGCSLPSSTKSKGAVRDSTEVWMLNQAIDEAKGPAKKSLKEKRLAVLSKHTGVDITKPPPASPLVEASPPPSTDPAVASKLIADLKAVVRDTPAAAPTKVHIVKSVRLPPFP